MLLKQTKKLGKKMRINPIIIIQTRMEKVKNRIHSYYDEGDT